MEPDNDEEPANVAVALHYESNKGTAARVVAKGRGFIAERIVAQAQAADVPIERNKAWPSRSPNSHSGRRSRASFTRPSPKSSAS
jgi:FlhB HrpN YscU SpaS Family